ncbi:MAG: acetylxylan esterase, partial [Verrucomicrobiaceae bacterium]
MTGLIQAQDIQAELSIVPDRPDAIYRQGEIATFTVRMEQNGKPMDGEVEWTFLKNGLADKMEGVVSLQGGSASISGTLSEPGFLPAQVKCEIGGKKLQAETAAGFDPLEIKPSMPVPGDFDTFWNEKKKSLAAVPANAVLTPVKSPSPRVEVFDLKADCVGRPVSGYLARPIGAKPRSLPAMLTLHGTGVLSSDLGQSIHWASQGLLALDMNAHGLPNGQPKEFYTNLAEGDLKNYGFKGCRSRDDYYFLGMYLRLIRAIDVLTSQPEWDGRTLIVHGDSQGGQQAIAAAGLDAAFRGDQCALVI